MVVAEANPGAPGIRYARRHNVPVVFNLADLKQFPGVDIMVNATGIPGVAEEIQHNLPDGVSVLNCNRSHSWEDFWDIISRDLSFTEDFPPLKIGIIGGGRGGQRVLQHIAAVRPRRQRLEIIGMADPDLMAPGMLRARNLGIPTYPDFNFLLEQSPDLILELTGDPEVREKIMQLKPANTQIIDHLQSRLFGSYSKRKRTGCALR